MNSLSSLVVKVLSSLVLLSSVFYLAYLVKVKLDINLFPNVQHFPRLIEGYSFGLIRCEWFPNPHHCD